MSPRVVGLRDRRMSGVFGVAIPGETSDSLIYVDRDPRGDHEVPATAVPEVALVESQLTIGAHSLTLPFLDHPDTVRAVSGCVVATAVDSQRIWLVRS